MPGQVSDSCAQYCDLNLSGTGICRVPSIFFDDLGLGLPIQTASAVGCRRSSVLSLLCSIRVYQNIQARTGTGFPSQSQFSPDFRFIRVILGEGQQSILVLDVANGAGHLRGEAARRPTVCHHLDQ